MLNAAGLAYLFTHRNVPFDSTRRKNDEDIRPQMVHDLLENHDLAGESHEVVRTLLGAPRGRDSVRNGTYIYWAGTDGVIDDMWLEISFDNELVVAVHHAVAD